jgi:cysteine desulfurase/selenocysteine lyase
MSFTQADIEKIRSQFPILKQTVNGKPLVYFDNAATTQKPIRVIESLKSYYEGYNANIHRGVHTLAEKATAAYEDTRKAVQEFIGAAHPEECVFVRGTTEGINLVAQTYGKANVQEDDEVVISEMEHHSNIVPWQMLCAEKKAKLRVIPITDTGELKMECFSKMLSAKTKIVAVTYASNSLGTINDIRNITAMAHAAGARVVIDAAQAVSHLPISVSDPDVDFLVFSAHKMYGPTGVGVLYGKKDLLDNMPPYQGGGEMIREVTFEKTTYQPSPYRFEAGTPNIAGVVAFRAAIDFINELGKGNIAAHEKNLLHRCAEGLMEGNEGGQLKLIGTARDKVSVQSFVIQGLHHLDAGMLLDAGGIAVRTGHHCTQPLMSRYGIEGTIRPSFAVYNTEEEVQKLVDAVKKILGSRRAA